MGGCDIRRQRNLRNSRGSCDVPKHYINARKALLRLSTDKDGVMSLEYVIVAAFVVTVVIAGYNTGNVAAALTTGFTALTTAMAAI